MSTFNLVAIVFFVAVVAIACLRLLWQRRQFAAPATLVAAAGLGVLLLVGSTMRCPTDAVIVVDQPLRGAAHAKLLSGLLDELKRAGVERVSLMMPGPSSGNAEPWLDVSDDNGTLAVRLIEKASQAPSLQAMVESATAQARQRTHWQRMWDLLRGRSMRVVIGLSDSLQWKRFHPVEVDALLADARVDSITYEVVELTPHPIAAQLDIHVPLPLAAGRMLTQSGVEATVSVRSPHLAAAKGKQIEVTVSGRMIRNVVAVPNVESDEGILATGKLLGAVNDQGVLTFALSLSRFRSKKDPAQSIDFRGGFALIELDAAIGGDKPFRSQGSAYVPVRSVEIAIVAGPGSGTDRLREQSLLQPKTLAPIRDLLEAIDRKRAGPLAHFRYQDAAAFTKQLDSGHELPFFVVLHEMPRDFWSLSNVEKLLDATSKGMHLMVIDPPTLPADKVLADKLRRLLPAFAQNDTRSADPATARTVDGTPILHLVFDIGRWGHVPETPFTNDGGAAKKALDDALEIQYQTASALVEKFRKEGLIHGKLTRPIGASGRKLIHYDADANDRIIVRVAPAVFATDDLGNTIFPSAMELRLAVLFASEEGIRFDRDRTGAHGAKTPGALPALDPIWSPNQAIVLFTGEIPQPQANGENPGTVQPEIAYRLEGDPTPRIYRENADGMFAQLLMRGMHITVVRMEIPEYTKGFRGLTQHWPSGVSPFTRFQLTPADVLGAKLSKELSALADSKRFLLDAVEAQARLLTKPGQPFFASIDMSPTASKTAAAETGVELADRLLPQLQSPRMSMSSAVVAYDRLIDGRIGPGKPTSLLRAWQSDEARLVKEWPLADRWAAPRRFRALTINDALPIGTVNEFIHAVDTGITAKRVKPMPLMIGGIVGNAHIVCLGYSPLETTETWWDLQDTILKPGVKEADHFGPQRLLDMAYLTARLRPLPINGPVVREVLMRDARGELQIIADFLPGQKTDSVFWTPNVVSLDDPGLSVPLELASASWSRGEMRFRLTPTDAAKLFGTRSVATVSVDFGGGAPSSLAFPIKRPLEARWAALTAYQSAATLAQFSGGTVGAPADLRPGERSLRTLWLLAFVAILAGIALARSRWRWASWLRRARAQAVPEQTRPIFTLDIPALVERIAQMLAEPRSGRRNGIIDSILPFASGMDLRGAVPQSLLRLALGIPELLKVEQRVRQRSLRVDLIVNVGASMRVAGGGPSGVPKVFLAGVCVQLLAEIAWLQGAEVRVIAVGLAGAAPVWGPASARDHDGGLIEQALVWASLPAGPIDAAGSLEPEAGAIVIWVSDFLDEEFVTLANWGASMIEQECKFAGMHVFTPEDAEQVGVGFSGSPFTPMDRSGCTPDDLRQVLLARLAQARRVFAQQALPLAAVQSTMTGEEIVAEMDEAGVFGTLR